MIWFACKGCGKKLKRPDEAGGSLIFCECGQANRVPWESTLPESEIPAEPEPPRRAERPPEERRGGRDLDSPWRESWSRRRGWEESRRRDPDYCFNHEERRKEKQCADCGEHFCAGCVAELGGKTLCGPCKNFHVQATLRPPRLSAMAIIALIVGLVSAPVAFCMGIFTPALGTLSGAGVAVGLGGALVPAVGLVLGLMALREVEANPRLAGRGMALIGTATSAMGVLWCLALTIATVGRFFVE